MHIIILAGGGGTRLWPLSREEMPKQFLSLCSNFSLLQETVLRFLGKYPILIVTQASYEALVKSQLEQIDASGIDILFEPARKNTAPAIALALRFLEETGKLQAQDPVLVLPSDHWMYPTEGFLKSLLKIQSAVQRGKIATFGTVPTKPETGFGYIQLKTPFDSTCYLVEQFIEKPDLERAREFISDPSYYWNSGMFAFSPSTMWEAFSLHLPALYSLKEKSFAACLASFPFLPNISLDYGVIEKTDRVVCCPLSVGWSDVGSFENLYEVLNKDEHQNVKKGTIVTFDTKKCLIVSKKKVVALDLEEMVVIDTDDILFIGKKKDAQKIKEFLAKSYARI